MIRKRKQIKVIAVLVALTFLLQTVPGSMNTVHATLSKRPAPTQTADQYSSTGLKEEYYHVTTPLDEKNTIYVEGKTKIATKRFCIRLKKHKESSYAITAFVSPNENGEFSIKINTKKGNTEVPEVIDGKGTVVGIDGSWATQPGYKPVETMGEGIYHLTIARAVTTKDAEVSPGAEWYNGPLGGSNGYAYKEALLSIKSGDNNNPKLVQYQEAYDNNKTTRNLYEKKSYTTNDYLGSYVRYKDRYMKDISFVFKNPETGKLESMNTDRVSYLKKVADQVTAGAASDYEKLLKIYEYVSGNIYYDDYAYQQKKNEYANPYRNLYNLRNNKSSKNSVSVSGGNQAKVATTCQGYAAMVIALARNCNSNIPARMVYGHHISQPVTIWADKKDADVSKRSHWWAEAYVDGKWVIIDANSGTMSKWKRSSFSNEGTWENYGLTTYAAFDPSDEQFANSYSYNGIYQGSDAGKFVNRKSEVNQLKSFLNIKSKGITNGKRLNAKYKAADYSTWGTGAANNFNTDGYGRVYRISWGKKNLAGKLNLSGFSKLKYLTLYNNQLTSLNLSDCSSLENLSANYNKLTTFDGTTAKNLKNIALEGNKLTVVKFRHGGKNITIQRNKKVGSFGFVYNKGKSQEVTVYVNQVKGHKYLGIYDSAGKRLSKNTTYSFTPTKTKYYVKYK